MIVVWVAQITACIFRIQEQGQADKTKFKVAVEIAGFAIFLQPITTLMFSWLYFNVTKNIIDTTARE